MKIEIEKLVKACGKNIRKLVQLDDIIENLHQKKIISFDDFSTLQENFYESIENIYGVDFLDKLFDVFNSAQYIENL